MTADTDIPEEPQAPQRWRWPLGPVRTMVAISIVLSLFFLAFPQLDIWFSGLFYDPEHGFAASHVPFFKWLRDFAAFLLWLIAGACLLSLAAKLAFPRRRSLIPTRASLFLLSTLIIATGIIVNAILKSFWGRPRPVNVIDFGGADPFVGVWHMAGACTHNCSFVSGEASSGIWLLGLALVVPLAWRSRVAIITLVLAIVFSLNRIAFGGHFLSDVLISWSLTLLVMAIAHHFLFVKPPRGFAADELEGAMTRAGVALRRIGRPRAAGKPQEPPAPPSSNPPREGS